MGAAKFGCQTIEACVICITDRKLIAKFQTYYTSCTLGISVKYSGAYPILDKQGKVGIS